LGLVISSCCSRVEDLLEGINKSIVATVFDLFHLLLAIVTGSSIIRHGQLTGSENDTLR